MLPMLLTGLETPQNKAWFILFYEANKTRLYRYALALLHDPTQAEDALQNAWLSCVQHAETFFQVPANKRLAWMRVVVKNAAFSLHNKETRYTALDPDWDLPAQDDSGHRDIVEIIRAMPPQYRSILELKFVLEWSDQAIASHLGLSPGAVRTRIWRGRKLLQETLVEEGYQP